MGMPPKINWFDQQWQGLGPDSRIEIGHVLGGESQRSGRSTCCPLGEAIPHVGMSFAMDTPDQNTVPEVPGAARMTSMILQRNTLCWKSDLCPLDSNLASRRDFWAWVICTSVRHCRSCWNGRMYLAGTGK